MLTKALIVNALVLFDVLEADLGGARKVTNFRLLRPLLTTAAIVPMFLVAVATHGTGLALEIGGSVAGVLFGIGVASLMSVRRDPASGQVVTGAGAVYAALWIAIIAARSAFSIGAEHWFNHSLATWMATNNVTPLRARRRPMQQVQKMRGDGVVPRFHIDALAVVRKLMPIQ